MYSQKFVPLLGDLTPFKAQIDRDRSIIILHDDALTAQQRSAARQLLDMPPVIRFDRPLWRYPGSADTDRIWQ